MAERQGQQGSNLRRTVVLVGMMGAGKTAVGRTLAAQLGVGFRDSDQEIERAASMSIPEIFARDGEPFFRAREHEVISRLLDGPPCVLSTGGGAFLSEANRRVMSEKGVSVWLDADLETLWQRVRHKGTRPLLRTADPHATLAALHAERAPVYALADLTVPSDRDISLADMALRVQAALVARGDILEQTP
ncbi:shikimate kinase [Allosediminivita pacifica]|uniref:Shikimate kinase n=1 Tax=Allosediminivita pacifica TaxID=1267769 RepID=A0A2T6AY90_9RHOB|nr:shikimate kinase [Allosediminivita pacifica]PTX48778.1 shikimate kinase [Allosediminivita pacifica]GGB08141.1 shikimate kinase [Allosediminivita pacifica]